MSLLTNTRCVSQVLSWVWKWVKFPFTPQRLILMKHVQPLCQKIGLAVKFWRMCWSVWFEGNRWRRFKVHSLIVRTIKLICMEMEDSGIKSLADCFLKICLDQPANTCGCSGGGRSSLSMSASMADAAAVVTVVVVPLAAGVCVSVGKLSRMLCTFCSTSSVQSMRSLSSWRAFSMTRSCLSPSPVSTSSRLWTWVRAVLPEAQDGGPEACGQCGDAWPDM